MANDLVAHAFDTDPPTLRLERGDQTRTLWLVGGDGRYEGQNVSLLHQGNDLLLNWPVGDGESSSSLRCVTR